MEARRRPRAAAGGLAMHEPNRDDLLSALLSELLGRLLTPRSAHDLQLDSEPRRRCKVGDTVTPGAIAVPVSMLRGDANAAAPARA
jgi:hypothetical protein